jgi:hypothetical protein
VRARRSRPERSGAGAAVSPLHLFRYLTSDPRPPVPTGASWPVQVGARVRALWPIKAVGTMLWIYSFFAAYFWVLRNPLSPVTVMPLTALDRYMQFQSGAVVLYASLWVYVSIAPALLRNFRELLSYGIATLALSAVGLGIFLLWPTAVPGFAIDAAQHPSVALLKGVDLPGNACPSLHVAFAVFTAIWMQRLLGEMHAGKAAQALNWLWCVGIVYSTLATRQHVVLDVVAGAPLGACLALVHMRAMRWLERPRTPGPAAAVASSGPMSKR